MVNHLKTISITSILLCSTFISSAQNINNTVTLQGKVLTSKDKPIANISSILYTAKDSVFAKVSVTDSNGFYIFERIKPGAYYIAFSGIGFKPLRSAVFNLDTQSVVLPNTILQLEAQQLKDVVVTANKPMFENKRGVMIMNVGILPTQAAMNTLELLETAPGISIENQNGKEQLSLKGQTVLILIDGKPTYLSGTDITNMLKNISAVTIDKIEIMTSPSARYDAAGNGIINIKTKKGLKRGVNGSLSSSYTQGIYPQINNSINFNYRNDKINVFGNYTYVYRMTWLSLDERDNFRNTNNQIIGVSHANTDWPIKDQIHNAKIGLDYSINKNNTVGITVSGSTHNEIDKTTITNNLGNSNGNTNAVLRSNANGNNNHADLSSNIHYKGMLRSVELNVDVDYVHYVQKVNQFVYTQAYDINENKVGDLFQLHRNGSYFTRIYATKIDLTYPCKNGLTISAGIKTSFMKSNNISDYDRFKGGAWVNASDISNHFIYEENINAAYITASKESKKWDLQAGLRMENTKLIRNQVLTNNNPLQTGYINFFPNAAITYHIKAKNDIGFSYSRRIERPDYQALNPATYFFDSLTYTQGNSNLQWALSNNFEINYTHKNITATVNYSSTIDAIANVQGRDAAKKIAYIIYKNLDRASNIGIAISVPVTIQSWWQSYFYAHLYNTYCKGVVAADVFDLSTTSILLKLNSTFTLNSTLTADIRGEYKSRRLNVALLEIGEPNYTIRAGITKMLFNKRVSLTLKAQTSTYEVKSSMQYGSIDAYFIQQFDVPRVGINFIYRFGKATVAKPTERSSSASDEERSRAGG